MDSWNENWTSNLRSHTRLNPHCGIAITHRHPTPVPGGVVVSDWLPVFGGGVGAGELEAARVAAGAAPFAVDPVNRPGLDGDLGYATSSVEVAVSR